MTETDGKKSVVYEMWSTSALLFCVGVCMILADLGPVLLGL